MQTKCMLYTFTWRLYNIMFGRTDWVRERKRANKIKYINAYSIRRIPSFTSLLCIAFNSCVLYVCIFVHFGKLLNALHCIALYNFRVCARARICMCAFVMHVNWNRVKQKHNKIKAAHSTKKWKKMNSHFIRCEWVSYVCEWGKATPPPPNSIAS